MPNPTVFENAVLFNSTVGIVGAFTPPDGSITNTKILTAAGIESSKVIHRFTTSVQLFAPGTTIVAVAAQLLHICRKGGVVVGIQAIITTQATGADRTVTVDLQKSTGGGAFASCLSTTVNITNTTPIRTPVAGTVGAGGVFIATDSLQLTVAVGGAAGSQAAGLLVSVDLDQNPNT